MSDVIELLERGDRPVAPSDGFRRQLLAILLVELTGRPGAQDPDVSRLVEAGSLIVHNAARFQPAPNRRSPSKLIVALAAAITTAVAIGLPVWLGRSQPDVPTPLATAPSTLIAPNVHGSFDGTTAELPDGWEPVTARLFGGGMLILATKDGRPAGGLPAMNATLFVAEQDTLRPIAELSDRPVQVAWDGSSIWAAHFETGALSRVNPTTGDITATVLPELAAPVSESGDRTFLPNDLETGFGFVWLLTARGAVAQIDQNTAEIVRVIELAPPHPQDLAVGTASVWVAQGNNTLMQIDPLTGTVSPYPLTHDGQRVVAKDGFVYVWGDQVNSSQSVVTVVNEATGQVGVIAVGDQGRSLGIVGEEVGVLFEDGMFREIRPTSTELGLSVELGTSIATNWDPTTDLSASPSTLIQFGIGNEGVAVTTVVPARALER